MSSAAYSPAYRQGPPTAGGATYHARAAGVWRDLATSFLHLLDGQTVERFSAMSDDALCAAVDATRPNAAVKVGKQALLTREQVLATINVPSAALLDALEASGGEDAEWRAVEESARELLAAARSGSPLVDVNVATRHHARFLTEHAPLRVHRRADGSVVLATHPHSQLWSLYEGALDLLGLRPLP